MNKEQTATAAAHDNPSNVERLRDHLKPDGLATSLLDAWSTDPAGASARLFAAFNNFHASKADNDGSPPKD